MNGILLGGIALALVLLVVITRPLLARIGASYAFARPRHTIFIVIGLMVAGSVVVSAGIVGDSASENVMESLLGRTEYGDGLITSSNPRSMILQSEAERTLTDPGLSGMVKDHSPGIRVTVPLDSVATGLGRDDATVWGVDPARHAPLQNAQRITGNVPAAVTDWPHDEVVLTQELARALGADIGDELTLYIPVTDERTPAPPVNVDSRGFGGSLVFATQSPTDGGYVHSPQDDYRTEFMVPPGTFHFGLTIDRTGETDAELVLHLLHEGEFYHEHVMDGTQDNFTLGHIPEGDWALEVHSPMAVGVGFSGTLESLYRDPNYVPPSMEPVSHPLTVRALIGDRGSDLLTSRGVAFLPLPAVQEMFDAPGRVNALFVVAEDGTNIDHFDDRLRAATDQGWAGGSPRVHVPLAGAEQMIQQIRLETQIFFLSSSMFTFLAGLLLIVVIMALLAEERKTTIATMRALGAKRWAVTRMYIAEGALYAGAAAAVAVIMASLLLFALRAPLANMYPELDGSFSLHWSPLTILSSMGVAFALTIATIAIAAHRATRLDPVQAMRGEEDEGTSSRSSGFLGGLVLSALGLFLLSLALLDSNPLLLLLGPTVLVVGLALAARRFTLSSAGVTAAALFVLLFSAWRLSQIDTYGGFQDFLVLPVGAVLLGLSAAALFVNARSLHRGLVHLTGRLRGLGPVVETALSHLRARPGRAFLTISMLATVLVVITTMGTMVTTFAPTGYEETGGYAVFGDSHFDLGDPQQHLEEHPPRSGIDPFPLMSSWVHTPWASQEDYRIETADGHFTSINYHGMVDRGAVGVTARFIENARFSSASTAPGYNDLDEALRAVAADPGLIVMSDRAHYWMLIPGGDFMEFDDREQVPVQVGDRLQIGGGDAAVQVVALIHDLDGIGSIVHPEVVEHFAERRGFSEAGTRIWANPASGVSDEELAAALEAAYRSAGMMATVASDPYPEWSAVDRSFTLVFMVFLSLGLVIGLVALGLVTVRNTMVRRREIGVLRAVGASPRQVLLVFAVEALYIMLAAIAIGFVGGLWTVWSLLRGDEFMTIQEGTLFVADPVFLGSIYAVTLAAGLVTALASSWHASKIPPAEAVRYVE